jgi:hypothetical protein
MRQKLTLTLSLLVLLHALSGFEAVSSPPVTGGAEAPLLKEHLEPIITVRAASGATIGFTTQNGQATYDAEPQALDLPYLVLYRNGTLTPSDERTLIVTVSDLVVPPSGLTVTLTLQTYHGDPDLGADLENRITVWRESRRLDSSLALDATGGIVVWEHEFGPTLMSGPESVATPTDYFRYEITIINEDLSASGPLHSFSQDHAFLMENQWTAPLGPEQTAPERGAPEELVVYYCDMFVFQHDTADPASRLRRDEIPHYVQTELVPTLLEALRVQTEDWDFPWQPAWTSYRAQDENQRLSVALSDGETWFHGQAPVRGFSGISLRTKGGVNRNYETLTDGLLSTFHHELFHNLQKGLAQQLGGQGDVDGQKGAWGFLSEGTAALAESVGQRDIHFSPDAGARSYISLANGFIGQTDFPGELNRSYGQMIPYYAAIYWRFLYEQCDGMADGTENPRAGMRIIRRALEELYSGAQVDIGGSSDLVHHLPAVIDQALAGPEAPDCPFQTFRESLQHFARAIYQLRLDGGRCTVPGLPTATQTGTPAGAAAGCSFYDPNHLYFDPPVSELTYRGAQVLFAAADQPYPHGIGSSYGIDLVDVVLDPSTQGQPLTIEISGAPGADTDFSVEIWRIMDSGASGGAEKRLSPVGAPEQLNAQTTDGRLVYTIPEIDTGLANRLGLIITRLDSDEASDPVGAYTITLQATLGR